MTPVWNSGISFGFFQNSGETGRYVFTAFAFLVSVWLIYLLSYTLFENRFAATAVAER